MLDKEPSTSAGFPSSYDAASYMDISLYMGKLIHCDLTYGNMASWSYWTSSHKRNGDRRTASISCE